MQKEQLQRLDKEDLCSFFVLFGFFVVTSFPI